MVYELVRGDVNRPIMVLCRTGSRSIAASNILANPERWIPDNGGLGLERFTNVRNIWEGFVGQNLYKFSGSVPAVPLVALDLNNNEDLTATPPFNGIDADYADVHEETKDANPDKDGWRNFAGLPWTTQIQKPLAYQREPGLYKGLNLTPVQ